MNTQEKELLQNFLHQLGQASGIGRDPEADALINQVMVRQPDAAYLLVQRALLQQQALDSAQTRIAALQQQVAALQAPHAPSTGTTSFLGGDANAWGNSARGTPASDGAVERNAYGEPIGGRGFAAAPVQAPTQPPFTQPAAATPTPGLFGGGSFLGNMAATAAGVAGGAFLFQGLENLLGHHGGAGHAPAMADLPRDATSAANAAGTDRDTDLARSAGVDDVRLDDRGSSNGVFDDSASLDDNLFDDTGGSDDGSSLI